MKMDIISNFVVFEGGDGSGTSTQLGILRQNFSSEKWENINFYPTFEPTDGEIGKIIRKVLSKNLIFQADTLARLFAADRTEHLYSENGIAKRCKAGELVVCDRYVLSSLVYQGIECGDDLPFSLNKPFPAPEILFFFDIEPELAQKRMGNRPSLEIYEYLDFQKKVREKYLSLLDWYRGEGVDVKVIDASQTVEKVAKDVWSVLSKMPIMEYGEAV